MERQNSGKLASGTASAPSKALPARPREYPALILCLASNTAPEVVPDAESDLFILQLHMRSKSACCKETLGSILLKATLWVKASLSLICNNAKITTPRHKTSYIHIHDSAERIFIEMRHLQSRAEKKGVLPKILADTTIVYVGELEWWTTDVEVSKC